MPGEVVVDVDLVVGGCAGVRMSISSISASLILSLTIGCYLLPCSCCT